MTRTAAYLTMACMLGFAGACGSRAELGKGDTSADASRPGSGNTVIEAGDGAQGDSDAAGTVVDAGVGDGPARDAEADVTSRVVCQGAFEAIYGCSQLQLPQAELDRLRPGFEHDCEGMLAMPGNATGNDAIVTCLQGIADGGCRTTPSIAACSKPGTLPGGGSCQVDSQCASGSCGIGFTGGPCGSCGTLLAPGDSCAHSGTCPPGTTCDTGGSLRCLAPLVVDAGAICGVGRNECAPGLVCNELRSRCMPLGAEGAPCGWTPDCALPLVCSNATCFRLLGAGASCRGDSECAHDLVCDTVAHTCGAVIWGTPGQPCGGFVRCLPGYPLDCSSSTTNSTIKCPLLLGQGEACSPGDMSRICDTFLQCISGVCGPAPSVTCP